MNLFSVISHQLLASSDCAIVCPEYSIEEYGKKVQVEASKSFYKKVAILAAAAGFFYYRTQSQSERLMLVPRVPDATWFNYLSKGKEFVAEIFVQQVIIHYLSPQLKKHLGSFTLKNFYENYTQIKPLSDALIQESTTFHLVSTKDDALYKINLVRDQVYMLFNESIKMFGYMYYEHKKVQDTLIASGMLRIIKKQQRKMEQLAQELSFCCAYYIDQFDDEHKKMKAASSFSVALQAYVEEFEADYKAFLLYLKGS